MVSCQVPVRQKFVHDTWAARDLPVLDATVALLEQSYMVTVTDIASRTGLDAATVARALETLDPVYVDFRKTTTGGDPRFWYVFKVTPEARRAVGQWPTAQALAGRLAEELAAAAHDETDPQRQGLLVYAARLVGDTLRDATVRAAAHVLSPAFGGVPQPELGMPVPEPVAEGADDMPSPVPLPELPQVQSPPDTASAV
jgi:predicted transcriptional regulator